MTTIKEKFFEIAIPLAAELKEMIKNNGSKVIGNITLQQVLTGMKGVVALLTPTSKLDPEEGIRFRGYSIPELQEKLPRINPEGEPLPEGIFHLMLLGEIPTKEDVFDLSKDWAKRADVPQHVFDVIDAIPKTSRPMTQFSAAILAMASESDFQKAYIEGINKADHWKTMFEDAMNLIARLPRIAAYIYRRNYHNEDYIDPDPNLDWAGNFSHMMGFDDEEVKRFMRLYLLIHSDHEGGNVSAHTAHLVGSALSNVYYSFAAAMTGLAGPLHGYANQEVIRWILKMVDDIGGSVCSNKESIKDYVINMVKNGEVIPGYGHAVLRKTDPRYLVLREFSQKYLPDYPLFKTVGCLYDVVPDVLSTFKKIKNPWPNVDAHSGVVLLKYGIKEYDFYTVMFGVARSLGIMAQQIWDRALGFPIERPSSQPFEWFREKAK